MTLSPAELVFFLVAGHFIVDYPLQGDTVAVQKSPLTDNALSVAVPWYYWMTAHALMHGATVAFLTGRVWMGVGETIAHWGIDYAKCTRRIGIHNDQGLHIACKMVWWGLCCGVAS